MSDVVPPNPTPVAPQQPPQQQINISLPNLDWKQMGNKLRLWLLILGGILFICFFTPQFYVSESMKGAKEVHSWLLWGWSTWWALLLFILGLVLTIVLALDLFIPALKQFRGILRLVYLIGWAILTLTTTLGLLLAIFGIGVHHTDLSELPKEYLKDISFFRFPITIFLVWPATVAAGLVSFLLVSKESNLKIKVGGHTLTPPNIPGV